MTIARIRFLKRKKILQDDIAIELVQKEGGRRFSAKLDFSRYDFPPTARVIVEAKSLMQTSRFDLGPARHSIESHGHDISRIESERVVFRVLVIDPLSAQKLGSAETVRPKSSSDSNDGGSILPVDLMDTLDGRVWRLDFVETDQAGQSDAPVLLIDRNASNGSAAEFVKSPKVRALIMPAIMQQVLERVLFVGEHEFDANGDGWRDAWLRLGAKLANESPPLATDNTAEDIHDWVNRASAQLSIRSGLLDGFIQEIEK